MQPIIRCLQLSLQVFTRRWKNSFSASSLFGTQHQLTHPPVKSSNLPPRKMPVFQGVAPRHTFFTSSCVNNSLTLQSSPPCSLLKNRVSQGLLFVNILTLSCLCSLWFATHPFNSLNPYVNLYYLWSISIAKDDRYVEKCDPRRWWS